MKCLTLCLILVSGSRAQEWTQVLLGWGDPQAGLPTDLTVLLVPTTITAGTVSFTSNGQSIAGCKEMQGHYFSPAVPEDEIAVLLTDERFSSAA